MHYVSDRSERDSEGWGVESGEWWGLGEARRIREMKGERERATLRETAAVYC